MAETAVDPKYKLMFGTQGRQDYLVIARNGNAVLGVKPNAIAKGSSLGLPGTMWLGVRIRAASAEGVFDPQHASNVVHLSKKFEHYGEAWPNIHWENIDAIRSSSEIGIFLRGSLDGTEAEIESVLDQIRGGKIAHKLMDYLEERIDKNTLILTREEIVQYLVKNYYEPLVNGIEKGIKVKRAVAEESQNHIGAFGIQAEILKKAYQKVQEETGESPEE